MMFHLSGTAWDGQRWRVAASITTLAHQIEVIRPGTYPADGTVASKNHDQNSPNSDHTVWPKTGSGVVYAIDITEAGGLVIDDLFEAIRLSADERLKYAIHDRLMFSSYPKGDIPPFTWRPYTGSAPHVGHGHLSVWHDARGEDPRPWQIGTPNQGEATMKRGDKGRAVAELQHAGAKYWGWANGAWPPFAGHSMYDAQPFAPGEDGAFGGTTETNVKAWQILHDLPATGVVDGIAAGMFFAPYGSGAAPDLSGYATKTELATHAANSDAHHA